MSRRFTSRGGAAIALSACIAVVAACGSRGPLDDEAREVDAGSADALTDVVVTDAPVDAPRESGGLIACGTCIVGQCGMGIVQCLQSTGCRTTLQCVVTTCLVGGSPDAACLAGCASGDPSGVLQMFQIFQCFTDVCGVDCGPILGGLLGGGTGRGGGRGGGGGRRPAGGAQSVPPLAEILSSQWPELEEGGVFHR